MSTYTLTTLTLCFILVIVATYISKSKGTLMEYMVFVMSFSMSIGFATTKTNVFLPTGEGKTWKQIIENGTLKFN